MNEHQAIRIASNDIWILKIIINPNYSITKNGVFTSLSKNGKGSNPGGLWRKIGGLDKYGYAVFQPRFNGIKRAIFIHRIVYAYFNGPLSKELVVNHKDGNRTNNHPENLELTTWKYNNAYRAKPSL